MLRYLVLGTATVAGVLFAPGRAGAHAMHADVKFVNDTVQLLAYFEEDVPAEFADVTVTDADGNIVLTGKTDERGVWTFPRPKPGRYTITAKLVGHVVKAPLPIDGAAEEAVTPTDRRNKWVGLALGVAGLLGVSGASWLLRRRTRRLE